MNDTHPEQIIRLGADACWPLLNSSGVGDLATAANEQADVFPVNYLVDGRTLLFRTAPGTKVAELELAPNVAFIVQGHDASGNWSVVIRGLIKILTDQVEVIGSGALELASWAPGPKRVFLRLTPASVEGRRVLRSDLQRSALYR
jgi:uncharacterized protein